MYNTSTAHETREGRSCLNEAHLQMSDNTKSEYENKIFSENTFLAQIKKKCMLWGFDFFLKSVLYIFIYIIYIFIYTHTH